MFTDNDIEYHRDANHGWSAVRLAPPIGKALRLADTDDLEPYFVPCDYCGAMRHVECVGGDVHWVRVVAASVRL